MIKEWLKSQPHLPDMNGKYSEQEKISFVRLCYIFLKLISSNVSHLECVTDEEFGFQFIASELEFVTDLATVFRTAARSFSRQQYSITDKWSDDEISFIFGSSEVHSTKVI
jgi:uncharacterized protein YcsI (UPF0317 family)